MSEQVDTTTEESVAGELGERVRAIIAAAEGMAAAVRSDADDYARTRRQEADAEAQRQLREAREKAEAEVAERLKRVGELSDLISERASAVLERLDEAEQVRAQLDALTRALGETAERVAREVGEAAAPPATPSLEEAVDAEPMTEQADEHVRPLRPWKRGQRRFRSAAPSAEGETRVEDARLVALQMAVAGRSRDEVAAHLREEFQVEDPDSILSQVFAEGFRPPPS